MTPFIRETMPTLPDGSVGYYTRHTTGGFHACYAINQSMLVGDRTLPSVHYGLLAGGREFPTVASALAYCRRYERHRYMSPGEHGAVCIDPEPCSGYVKPQAAWHDSTFEPRRVLRGMHPKYRLDTFTYQIVYDSWEPEGGWK